MIELLHSGLVGAFLLVTSVLLGLTLAQRMRVHDAVMTWRPVSAGSAWPVLFVGVIGVLGVFANSTSSTVPAWVFGGYLIGGILWFVAVLLGSTVVVTGHGIYCGFCRAESAAAWMQVTDHFEVQEGRKVHFVLLYRSTQGTSERLDVPVPAALADRFRLMLQNNLGYGSRNRTAISPGKRAVS